MAQAEVTILQSMSIELLSKGLPALAYGMMSRRASDVSHARAYGVLSAAAFTHCAAALLGIDLTALLPLVLRALQPLSYGFLLSTHPDDVRRNCCLAVLAVASLLH